MSDEVDAELTHLAMRLVRTLRELGFQADSIRDGIVASATSGFPFIIAVTRGGWLQFAMSVKNEQHRIGLEEVNHYNKSYRFGRLYLDEDQDLVLSTDLKVPSAGSEAELLDPMRMCMQIWGEIVGLVINLLRGQRYEARDDSAPRHRPKPLTGSA